MTALIDTQSWGDIQRTNATKFAHATAKEAEESKANGEKKDVKPDIVIERIAELIEELVVLGWDEQALKAAISKWQTAPKARNMTTESKHISVDAPIETFEWSIYILHALRNNNIRTLRELAKTSESDLLRMENIGKRNLNKIKSILSKCGLQLGMTDVEIDHERVANPSTQEGRRDPEHLPFNKDTSIAYLELSYGIPRVLLERFNLSIHSPLYLLSMKTEEDIYGALRAKYKVTAVKKALQKYWLSLGMTEGEIRQIMSSGQ